MSDAIVVMRVRKVAVTASRERYTEATNNAHITKKEMRATKLR